MKPTYTNDKKAPRMKKGEFSKMVITRELYNRFKKEFPQYKDMAWVEFYNNWLEIAAKVRSEGVTNPLGVKLGFFCGELKVQYVPYKFKTRDRNDPAGHPHLNLKTRGKVGKVKWERREAVKRNKILQFYAFDETREMTCLAHQYIEEHGDKLRVSRITIGGHSVWRQKTKK